jgi:hypothetical protein
VCLCAQVLDIGANLAEQLPGCVLQLTSLQELHAGVCRMQVKGAGFLASIKYKVACLVPGLGSLPQSSAAVLSHILICLVSVQA